MITTNRYVVTMLMLFLLSCVFSFGLGAPSSTPKCEELVFSNVHHVPEVDDYVGTEIVLSVCPVASKISGSWNEYEGYKPVTTILNGRRDGNAFRLNGENSEGKAAFVGQMKGERLVGKLVWYIGSNRQERNINLARKQCPVRPPN